MTLRHPQSNLKRANRWKLVALATVLLGSFIVVCTVENLLGSALLAFVVSYTLGPVVNYLERQGIGRATATVVVFAAIGLLLALLGTWLAPYLGDTLSGLQNDAPRLITGVGRFISDLEERLRNIAGPLASVDLKSRVEASLTHWTHATFERLPEFLKTMLTVMLLGPFLAFFMVKDSRNILRAVAALVPNNIFEAALSLQHQISVQIGQFVRARILESLIVALVTAIGLLIISFPYPLLLGVTAGVTNLIPYVGPIFGAIPAFLIALVNGYAGVDVALLAAVYIVAQLIDAGLLIPWLVAKIVDLHPVTVVLVIIAGAQLMGVVGMIICIPLAGTIKVTVSTIYRYLIDTRS